MSSIMAAYAPPEMMQQAHRDWNEQRISNGILLFEDGTQGHYLSCGMDVLGAPLCAQDQIVYSDAMINFMQLVSADCSSIVIMLRGNEFGVESLVDQKPHWDFSYGSDAAVPGRQFVRTKDVLNHFDMVTNSLLATSLLFKCVFPNARLFHVAAPPPIESEEHIRANPEIFGDLFREHGVRPFKLRKKIYDAMYDRLSCQLAAYGITTIYAPQECLTPEGGLCADYAHGCLHGNDKYGRALLGELIRNNLYASV